MVKRCSICKKIKLIHIHYFHHPICYDCDKGYIDDKGYFTRHNYPKIFRTTLELRVDSKHIAERCIRKDQDKIDEDKYFVGLKSEKKINNFCRKCGYLIYSKNKERKVACECE